MNLHAISLFKNDYAFLKFISAITLGVINAISAQILFWLFLKRFKHSKFMTAKNGDRRTIWWSLVERRLSTMAVLSEWLRSLTRNQMGSARTGSNPVDRALLKPIGQPRFHEIFL